MVDAVTTIGGWSAVAITGAGIWWYYTQQGARRKGAPRKASRDGPPAKQQGGSKDNKKKGKGSASEHSGNDVNVSELAAASPAGSGAEELKLRKKDKKNKKKNATSGSSAVDTTPVTSRALPVADDNGREEVDNKAFALQFQTAREGTSLKTTQTNATKVRTLKQGKANRSLQELNSEDFTESSAAPSTTGGDADDDLSPRVSPALLASPPKSDPHGISDMLEAPSAGPTTLRLVPSTEPPREQKPKKTKPAQEPETKKQRQRRAEAEKRKAQTAEAERERKALMEKQLKLARTAEGTAKSGQYRTYTPPATNAWASSNGDAQKEKLPLEDPFLDTFEAESPSAENRRKDLKPTPVENMVNDRADEAAIAGSSKSTQDANGTNGTSTGYVSSSSHSDDWESLQIRKLAQQEQEESGWQEVPAKKAKQGKRSVVSADA